MNRRKFVTSSLALPAASVVSTSVVLANEVSPPQLTPKLFGVEYPKDIKNIHELYKWIWSWDRNHFQVYTGAGLHYSGLHETSGPFHRLFADSQHVGILVTRTFVKGNEESRNDAYLSLISEAANRIYSVVSFGQGDVYWREDPEFDIQDKNLMTEIDENGPYRDEITYVAGHVNTDFGLMKFYTRLSCNKLATKEAIERMRVNLYDKSKVMTVKTWDV